MSQDSFNVQAWLARKCVRFFRLNEIHIILFNFLSVAIGPKQVAKREPPLLATTLFGRQAVAVGDANVDDGVVPDAWLGTPFLLVKS